MDPRNACGVRCFARIRPLRADGGVFANERDCAAGQRAVNGLGSGLGPNVQPVFDDIRGAIEAVGLRNSRLYFAGGEPIRIVFEDGSDGGAQALRTDPARMHDHTRSVRFDARRDSRLVIAQRDADQRHAFRQRFLPRQVTRRCPRIEGPMSLSQANLAGLVTRT